VRSHQLCHYHGSHPEYVPPAKKTKVSDETSAHHQLDLPAPLGEMRTVSVSCQTDPILPPALAPKKLCVGVNNVELEKFIENRFGKCVPDEDGHPFGERLKEETTFRARYCTRESSSEKATRCEKCQDFFRSMSSARSRALASERKGTQKFTPLSALRASPHVIDLLRNFREESKKSVSPPPPPLEQSEEDLEVESKEDNDYLINVLLTTMKKCEKLKGTYMGTLFEQQLRCLNESDGRAFRWNKEIVHWALTLQFHGGKRVIDDLRGKANRGKGSHGELNINVADWGLFLPANSTLRNYLPPVEVYEGFKDDVIASFKKGFPVTSKRFVMLAWDEIEIRHGLVWNASTKELIGKAVGSIAEKDAPKEDWIHMNEQLATHVVQFFLVSLDGEFSCPIGFYVMVKVSGDKVFSIVEPLFKKLENPETGEPLKIAATSSDAFPSNATLLEKLKGAGHQTSHIFDPLHLLKNMRNNIWNMVVAINTGEKGKGKEKEKWIEFNLNTLDDLLQSENAAVRQQFKALHPTSPFPKDQMDLAPIRVLLSQPLVTALQNHGDGPAQQLGEYLHFMRVFDEATTDNTMDNSIRFHNLTSVLAYFSNLNGLTGGLVSQVKTTVESLQKVFALCEKEGITFRPSVLGTIVVENFFSTVRAKCRYPNIWEYAVFARRAYFELIKENASDYLFIGPKKGVDQFKKYGNQIGIQFSMEQVNLMTKKEKKTYTEKIKGRNAGTEQDRLFCVEKARLHRCNRKRMTIREIKTKDSPFQAKAKLQYRVRCPSEGCQKNFVYEGALANHIHQKHGHEYETIERAQSTAHKAFEKGVARALRAHLEDNGVEIPHMASLIPYLDEDGLPTDDPESLDTHFEEEVLLEGMGTEVSTGLDAEEEFLNDEISKEALKDILDLLEAEPATVYDLGEIIVNHVAPQPPPAQQPSILPRLEDYFRVPDPLPREYPPPVDLEEGQRVRPVLIDFEINDFRHLEAIEMTVRCLVTGEVYSTLINCENPIHFRAWQVHNISRRMLQGHPHFQAVFKELIRWLEEMGSDEKEVVLFVAHNSAFDLRVMKKGLEKAGEIFPSNWVFYDSIKLVKHFEPQKLTSYALGNLAKHYRCQSQPTHRSASDVRCLAEILLKVVDRDMKEVCKKIVDFVFQL